MTSFHGAGGTVVYAVSTGTPPWRNAYGSPPRVFPEQGRALASDLDVSETDVRVERAGLSVQEPGEGSVADADLVAVEAAAQTEP